MAMTIVVEGIEGIRMEGRGGGTETHILGWGSVSPNGHKLKYTTYVKVRECSGSARLGLALLNNTRKHSFSQELLLQFFPRVGLSNAGW